MEVSGVRLEWRPNRKQALFLSIPVTIKEAGYLGGAGSGKSDVLLMYGIVHKWHENPRFKQVFMRRTYPELKKEIVPRSRDIYPKFGAKFNATDMAWTFPRFDQYGSGMPNAGAMVFLAQCEHENNVHQFDSMEISLYTPDEITSLTEYIYLYVAFERNRAPKGSGLPSITRSAGMPGGVGHAFVKKRFWDPCKEGSKIIVGKGGNKRMMIHATLEDNKDHIDPLYKQSLLGRPEAEIRAKLHGDFDAYLGQVFDEFRDKHYPDEPDNALHVIEPHQIPDYWPKLVIGDWGFAAQTYIGFFAVSPMRRLFLYRELSFRRTKIEEWAPLVKQYIENEKPRIVKFCKSSGDDRGQEQTIQEQISTALGVPIELSNNYRGSRVAGKILLHEYLRWRPKPIMQANELPPYDEAYAMRLYRLKGEEVYKMYLKQYEPPEEESNIPKLQIFCCSEDNHDGHVNCCPIMIDAIKACNYDTPKDGRPAEDVAEFDGDDPYDVIRYACDTAESYYIEATAEFDKVQKIEELHRRMLANQDWTMFYRNMRAVEGGSVVVPVSRYRH